MSKKILLCTLSFLIVLGIGNDIFSDSIKIHAQNGNNEHFEARNTKKSNNSSDKINEVYFNENTVTNEQRNLFSSLTKTPKTRKDELIEAGYVEMVDENKANEQTFKNEVTGEIKVLQYLSDELVLDEAGNYVEFDAKVKTLKNGAINIEGITFNEQISENKPLEYSFGEVNYQFYSKQVLTLAFQNESKMGYVNEDGNIYIFIVDSGKLSIVKSFVNGNIKSVSDNYKITSKHDLKLEDNDVVIYSGETELDRIKAYNNSEFIAKDLIEQSFDIDQETNMVEVKEEFNKEVVETLDPDVPLLIEYITNHKAPSPAGTKWLRGIRQNGVSYAYPPGPPTVAQVGALGQTHYVRIGKNVEGLTGQINESFMSIGFYEDATNYKDYIANYHVGKRTNDISGERDMLPVTLQNATFSLGVLGPGGTPTAPGMSVADYFSAYGKLEEGLSFTHGGTGDVEFTLNTISGPLNPTNLTWNNYHNNLGGLTLEPAAGNYIDGTVSKLNINSPVGVRYNFNVTNAVAKWNREGNVGNQFIKVAAEGWDFYAATSESFLGGPFVELTLKELPNFITHEYDINKTTVKLRSFASNDQKGAVNTRAIAIDGLTSYDADVEYEIYDQLTGMVLKNGKAGKGKETYKFPYYIHQLDRAQNYYELESNYQIDNLVDVSKFDVNRVYGVRVKATKGEKTSGWVEGDKFQLYKVGYKFERFNRILNFYGRNNDILINESKIDNNMINSVISENNLLFIRNPKQNAGKPYVAPPLEEVDKFLIDASLMGMNEHCEYGYEPINFNTGNFFYNQRDGRIYDGRNPVNITRYYNSKALDIDSIFGRGYSSMFDVNIQLLNNGSAVFRDETGRSHVMAKNSDETYNASRDSGYSFEIVKVGVYDQLVDNDYYIGALNQEPKQEAANVDKFNYLVKTKDATYYFNDLLQIEKIITKENKEYIFENGNNGVVSLTIPSGKRLELKYNEAGYVSELLFPDLTSTKYKYDSIGRMSEFSDQEGNVVEYKYESDVNDYLMTSYNGKGEEAIIKNTYDDSNRVVKQVDSEGNTSKLSYKDGYTVLEDASGNTHEVHYNKYGHTTKIIDNDEVVEKKYDSNFDVVKEIKYSLNDIESKQVFEYSYDENHNKIKTVNPNGLEFNLEYDNNGNLIKASDDEKSFSMSYDSNNQMSEYIDLNGGAITYTYNDKGYITSMYLKGETTTFNYDNNMNMISRISPTGTTTYTYDASGYIKTKINEFGGEFKYQRSSRGELLSVEDPYGYIEEYQYDNAGNMVSMKDRNGNVTNYEYDSLMHMTKEITPYKTINYTYDESYNLITIKDGNVETNYEYDLKNRLVKTITPSGNEEETTYDDFDNVLEIKDSLGIIEKNEYNEFNQLINSSDGNDNLTKYSYDKFNRVYQVIENDVKTLYNVFDKKGNLTLTSDGNMNTVENTYDEYGNLIVINNAGIINTKEYNSNGQVTTELDGLSNAKVTKYGCEGTISETVDADGVVTSYVYDKLGRNTELKVSQTTVAKQEYYPNGEIKTTTDGNGNITSFKLDEASRVIEETYASGATKTNVYDINDNVIKEINAFGDAKIYEYDKSGNKIKEVDEIGRITTYSYDLRNRLTKTKYEDKTTEESTYDNNNNILTSTSRDKITTSYTYDKFNRVIKEEDSTARSNSYTYDKVGNKISETNHANQTNTYKYNANNMLISTRMYDKNQTNIVYDSIGRVSEEYDIYANKKVNEYTAASRLLRTIDINNGVTTNVYDNMGRVVEVIDPLNQSTKTEFDNNSNVLKTTNHEGYITENIYDNMNRVVETINKNGNSSKTTYDKMGNVVTTTNAFDKTQSFKYDKVNRQIESIDELGFKSSKEYDVNDNVVKTKDANGNETKYQYEYDKLIKTTDAKGYTSKNTYDKRGNIITSTDNNGNKTTNVYDQLDRVVKVHAPNGNITTNTYNSVGDLIKVSDNLGIVNSYTYNNKHQKIEEKDAKGKSTKYTYAIDGTSVKTLNDPNNNVFTYEYDLLYRVSKQIDTKGVETTFKYDSSGNTLETVLNNKIVYKNEYDGENNLIKSINPINAVTSKSYDALNNIVSETDALGNVSYKNYDDKGRLVEEIDNENNKKEYVYDAINKIQDIDEEGFITSYEYDSVGNLTKVKDALDELTTYSYDGNKNMISTIKSGKVISTNTYDESNNLTSVANNSKKTDKYKYDVRNNVSVQTLNDNTEITYKYNELNQVIEKLSKDSKIYNTYDNSGNLSKTTVKDDKTTDTTIKYDQHNQIIESKDDFGNTIKYTYDQFGNRTSITYSDGSVVSYQYDELNRLIKVIDKDGEEITYKYDANNNRISENLPNNIKVNNTYDKNSRLIKTEHTKNGKVINSISYKYTKKGQVKREVRQVSSDTTLDDESEADTKITKDYVYDGIGQLTKATYTTEKNGVSEEVIYKYSFNKLNSRKEVEVITNGKSVKTDEIVDNDGKILYSENSEEKIIYSYDKNGNITKEQNSNGEVLTYEYNGFNQLTSITASNGIIQLFDYDGLGNRISKELKTPYDVYNYESNGNKSKYTLKQQLQKFIDTDTTHKDQSTETLTLKESLEKQVKEKGDCKNSSASTDNAYDSDVIEYVNDINATNALVLEIKEEDSTVQNVYAGSKPILEIDNGELQVLITDHKNSVIGEVTNSSLTINEYEASGANFESNLIKSNEKVNRLGYNGEVEDSYNLQYLRARYYKQDSSRFISEDTYRGQVGSPLSHHLYTYTENDPVNNTDPTGHKKFYVYGKWHPTEYNGTKYYYSDNAVFKYNNKLYGSLKEVKTAINNSIKSTSSGKNNNNSSGKTAAEQNNDFYSNPNTTADNPNPEVTNALSDKGWTDELFSRVCQYYIDQGIITVDTITRIIKESKTLEEARTRVREEIQKNQQTSSKGSSFEIPETAKTVIEVLQWILAIGGFIAGIVFTGFGDLAFDLLDLVLSALLGDTLGIIIGVIALAIPAIGSLAFKGIKSVDNILKKAGELVGDFSGKVVKFLDDNIPKVVNGIKDIANKDFVTKSIRNGVDKLSNVVDETLERVKSIFSRFSDDIFEGTGKYKNVGGHHTSAQSLFKGNTKYNAGDAFSVSLKKLSEFNENAHKTISKNQRKLYTEFSSTGKKLTFNDVYNIESKSMIDADIPVKRANAWAQKSIDDLKSKGLTDSDIINIPWNGSNK